MPPLDSIVKKRAKKPQRRLGNLEKEDPQEEDDGRASILRLTLLSHCEHQKKRDSVRV